MSPGIGEPRLLRLDGGAGVEEARSCHRRSDAHSGVDPSVDEGLQQQFALLEVTWVVVSGFSLHQRQRLLQVDGVLVDSLHFVRMQQVLALSDQLVCSGLYVLFE